MDEQPKLLIPNWVRILLFMGLLYTFFVAIGLMGGAFKLLGKDAAEALINATNNPFTGLLIGILATAIVQSSSATTSMVVALVSAGDGTGLGIGNAVPIIMGANIGTSVTNLIVSLGHIGRDSEFERAFSGAVMHDFFNVLCVIILLPFEIATGYLEKMGTAMAHFFTGSGNVSFSSPVKVIVKPVVNTIKNFFLEGLGVSSTVAGVLLILFSFILLFFALTFIVKNMRHLMLERLEVAVDRLFGANPVFAILVGAVITAIIQSSSITTSLLVPLIGAGVMSLEAAFPITIGANIGTTITALLASLAGDVNGLAIAFVHFCFNITGMLLIYPVKRIRQIPLILARKLAHVAVRRKWVAIAFLLGVFYAVPLLGFGISSLLGY